MSKKIIIVGGGIAGLSAGCYTRMNGYDSVIYEMHDKPGGLCTAWERKGYTVDGCLHWLVGSAPGNSFHRFWQELGVLEGRQVIDLEEFYRYEATDGKVFTLYCNIDRLEEHMLELAPEDAKHIRQFAGSLRRFAKFDIIGAKPPELAGWFDKLRAMVRILPVINEFRTWGRMTAGAMAAKFQNPLLRNALVTFHEEFSSIALLFTLAWLHNKNAGYLIGGSMPLARAVEKRYLGLGGKINYRSRVARILVENDRAVGIRLENGEEHRADYVISAADGHATIFDMLKGKYADDTIRGYYRDLPIFAPLIYISLGVKRDFGDFPQLISGAIMEIEPARIAGRELKTLHCRIANFDPTLAPQGKSIITLMIETEYEYWKSLRADTARYKAEKQAAADTVIGLLDKRFPGLAGQVEMIDVSTPVTFERYTGNWQGSYEGWLITPKTQRLIMKKTLPGLDNFYMVGQWVSPGGGLPTGAMTGREVAQLLCHRDEKKFTTTLA